MPWFQKGLSPEPAQRQPGFRERHLLGWGWALTASGLSCRLHPGPRGQYLLVCVCLASESPSGMSAPGLACGPQAPSTGGPGSLFPPRSPELPALPSSPDAREARRKPLARRAGPTASPALLTPRLLPCALTQRPPGPAPGGPCLGRVGCPAALPLEGSAPARPAAESCLPAVPSAPAPCRPGDGEEGCTSGPHPARPPPAALSWRPVLCRTSSPSPTFSSAKCRWRSTTRSIRFLCRGCLVLRWRRLLGTRGASRPGPVPLHPGHPLPVPPPCSEPQFPNL